MEIRTDLCVAVAEDGERLHGLLYRPDDGSTSELGVICIHGVGNNFYASTAGTCSQHLAARGLHAFSMNTRGHDWIARSATKREFNGATYENFDESLLDLDAGLALLGSRGYTRYVVFGHSLGGVKAVYYQGTRQRTDVVGVVSCSSPKQFYRQRAIDQEEFPQLIASAQSMIDQGKSEEFLWAPTSESTGLFTARTYVSKYGPAEQTDVRPHAANLRCPLLATAGGIENPVTIAHARELAEAAGPGAATSVVIDGADHGYHGRMDELADLVVDWVNRLR